MSMLGAAVAVSSSDSEGEPTLPKRRRISEKTAAAASGPSATSLPASSKAASSSKPAAGKKTDLPPPSEPAGMSQLLAVAQEKPHVNLVEQSAAAKLAAAAVDSGAGAETGAAAEGDVPNPPKRKLPCHFDWKVRHRELLSTLPAEAWPPAVDHGEHSYTVMVPVGPRNIIAKIEVHIRNRGFRINFPKLTKEEKPSVPWGDDINSAWATAVKKATQKVE